MGKKIVIAPGYYSRKYGINVIVTKLSIKSRSCIRFSQAPGIQTIRFGPMFGAVGPLLILKIQSVRGRSLGLRELGSTLSRQDGTIVGG